MKDIRRVIEELDSNEKLVERIIQDNKHRLNVRPSASEWSIGECIAHLSTVANQLSKPLTTAIRDARAQGKRGEEPFRYGVIGRWFTKSMEPPVKRKSKTFKIYEPTVPVSPEALMREFRDAHDTLKQLAREADGLDLARIKMKSPAFKWLKIGLGDWFFSTAAHERRHIWQAEETARRLTAEGN